MGSNIQNIAPNFENIVRLNLVYFDVLCIVWSIGRDSRNIILTALLQNNISRKIVARLFTNVELAMKKSSKNCKICITCLVIFRSLIQY